MNTAAAQPDALLAWMESLADPTRLRLLALLERRELGVVDLCDALQVPQSTASRHLKVLSDQGWTRNRRSGTVNLYRMEGDDLDDTARRLWQLAKQEVQRWPSHRQDALRLEQRLRRQQEESQSFFASAAAEWDKTRIELYGQGFNQTALLSLMPPHWTVADLGCGSGVLSAALAPFVAKVIAVDQSQAMLRAAKARAGNLPNVDLRRGDLEALPIDAGTCDAALMVLVLTYVADPAPVLRELARVLKPGGSAVILDLQAHDRESFRQEYGQHWPGFEPAALAKLLQAAGFTNVLHTTVPSEAGVKGPALFLTRAITQHEGLR